MLFMLSFAGYFDLVFCKELSSETREENLHYANFYLHYTNPTELEFRISAHGVSEV